MSTRAPPTWSSGACGCSPTCGTRPTPTTRSAAPPPAPARRACSAGLALKRRWQHSAPGGGQAHRPAQHRHGHQRAGVLGEVRQLTGTSRPGWSRWKATGYTSTADEAVEHVRREHHRRGRHPRLHLRRQLRAGRRDLRGARRLTAEHRARHPGARRRRLRRDGRAILRSRPGVGLPPPPSRLDQHLRPQVRAGLPRRRLGGVARHRRLYQRTWYSGSTTSVARCRPSR